MKRSSRCLKVLLLMFAALLPFGADAAAKKKAAAPAPVIDNFNVDPANEVAPGTEIGLFVNGTPKGKATVRITGLSHTITLNEVEPGVYEGSYTVRKTDKIAPTALVRSTLTKSGRSAV